MDEQLRAAYDRLDGALAPPGDAVALVAGRVRSRRRRRASTAVAGAVAAVLVVSGVTWGLQSQPEPSTPGPAAPTPETDPSPTPQSPPSPSPTSSPPSPDFDVDCEGGAGWRVGTVVNPEAYATNARYPRQAGLVWLDGPGTVDVRQADDDHAVVDLVKDDGRLFASLVVSWIDGAWRTRSISTCTQDFPGLESAEVYGSGLPLVELVAVGYGHCWIETLSYDGREWDLRDEDQFGWGGPGPEEFDAVGSVKVRRDRLEYVDLSGTRLSFVPADTPGTEANEGICD
jgi:hypothetical protein